MNFKTRPRYGALHTPEIVFLLAVMIGKGDRHRRLAGAAGDLSRMRVVGIGSGGSGDGTRKLQSGRGGRKLLALAAGDIAPADVAACDVLDQFQQMAVLNLLNTVGKNHKPAIDFIEFVALKLVSELFAAQSQRVAAGVLAQHQPGIGYAYRL